MEKSDQDLFTADHGQPGWRIRSSKVEVFITEQGGQMAPVTFDRDTGNPIEPYYISPWQQEGLESFGDPVLASLRGDFFCLPFGANAEPVGGENHSVHGQVASSPWAFADFAEDSGRTTLTLEMETTARPGKVTKEIHLIPGQNVIYTNHVVEGFAGPAPVGHHSILDVPEEEGSLRVAVSDFEIGHVPPELVSNPAQGEYQSLEPGATFTDLAQVPVIWKNHPHTDCTSFPRRPGFTDILQLFRQPASHPAWTVAYCPARGYLWFCLKDASLFPGTILWISNRGRHGSPWNGRNRCLGIEETCSYFAEGLKPSIAPNLITQSGFPTAVEFSASQPMAIPFIQGVVPISEKFTELQSVEFKSGRVTFTSTIGESLSAEVFWKFLESGQF